MLESFTEIMTETSTIKVFHGLDPMNPPDDNVDVEVLLEDGSRWGATFFTVANIRSLMDKVAATGEASGDWFWAANMIMIRELTLDSIRAAVEDIYATGYLASTFGILAD